MLLASVWRRLLVAGAAAAALWTAVWWASPDTPTLSVVEPAVPTATRGAAAPRPPELIVRSGDTTPYGGRFDRFDVTGQPVLAPVNANGQVAFHATVPRSVGREGIFVASAGHVTKIAAVGDDVPGGGTISGFTAHPLPALNASGHVAFGATIAGGRATEAVFLNGEDGLRVIAQTGDEAPGIATGVLTDFEAPALNDNDELAVLAGVRRGDETLDVLYFWNGRRLARVVAERDLLPRIGGTMDKMGAPALNNRGVIAFPAALFKGPRPGGIFVAGSRELRLLAAAGDQTPDGAMIARFSDHVAIDEQDGIAFGAFLATNAGSREAILRVGPDAISVIAVEGDGAPGGGRYAAFGPWPTAASDGTIAFIAALEGGAGPLAAFAGPGELRRIVTIGDRLRDGTRIGRFAVNGVAGAGPGGVVTVVTTASEEGDPAAIYRLP
jgi:hypothetical protein